MRFFRMLASLFAVTPGLYGYGHSRMDMPPIRPIEAYHELPRLFRTRQPRKKTRSGLNQRQRRKDRRRAHAAGKRQAFA